MKKILMLSLMIFPLFAETAPVLNGNYEMEIRIGAKTFIDLLELVGVDGPINLQGFDGKVSGVITVPDVFSAPLTGTANCSAIRSSCQLEFEIIALENGHQFKVRYEASLAGADYQNALSGAALPLLHGTAFLEDERVLGLFSAKMKIH
jgi:hypothetical protein